MKKQTLFFLLITFCSFNYSQAQEKGTQNIVGTNFLIKSEVLGEEREIQVYLPEDYETSDKQYPVLFLLDGQRLFLYGASLLKSFTKFEQSPEFIVVGITNEYPQRFSHFSGGARKFIDFLEKDVIIFVNDNFRTSGERLLFGWEYGGGLVIQTMAEKPELFDAYIAASPFPLSERIKAVDSLLTNNTTFEKVLYFTAAVDEGMVKDGTDKLNDLLTNKMSNKLNWTYRQLEDEEHRSTPYATIYHGLRTYYHYYPELQFNSLESFTKSGGLTHVYNYYKQRANQFGFAEELTPWTMFSLTRNAMRAGNYEQFDDFVSEFKPKNYLNQIRVSRACSIAAFYLQHNQNDKALEIFSSLSTTHPNSERPLNGLGDVYSAMKDEKKAAEYYQKAKELKKDNSN